MMKNENSTDFTEEQFKTQNKDVTWLCRTIRNDGYEFGAISAPENTIEWLNEILQLRGFFDMVMAGKRVPELSEQIKRLNQETAGARKRPFTDATGDERAAITQLNRLIMEAAYREAPRSDYQLTAFIRNRQGDTFLHDYESKEAFKRDLKEHRSDVEWGLLVRCDTGKVIADYLPELGDRDKIGIVQTEPQGVAMTPEELNPRQAALHEAAIKHFKSKKLKTYISGQMKHISGSRQLGETVKFLFDDSGKPTALTPVEDIIAERENTEAKIKWLDAICSELRNALTSLKEAEEGALELLAGTAGTDQ